MSSKVLPTPEDVPKKDAEEQGGKLRPLPPVLDISSTTRPRAPSIGSPKRTRKQGVASALFGKRTPRSASSRQLVGTTSPKTKSPTVEDSNKDVKSSPTSPLAAGLHTFKRKSSAFLEALTFSHGESESEESDIGEGDEDEGTSYADESLNPKSPGQQLSHKGCAAIWNARVPIHPASRFRISWDVIAVLLIIWNSFELPYRLAFRPDLFDQSDWSALDMFVDVFFLTDVLINFLTGRSRGQGNVDFRFKKVFRGYIRSWFWLDLISALPIDSMVNIQVSTEGETDLRVERVVKLIRLSRMVRLARISRMARYVQRGLDSFDVRPSPLTASVSRMVLSVIWYLHWSACAAYAIVQYDEDNQASEEGFRQVATLDHGQRYVKMVHNSVHHFLASESIAPETVAETIMTMLSMLIGSLLFTLVFGVVLSVLMQLSANDVAHIVWRKQLDAYMGHKRIPGRLRRRVRAFLDHLREKRAFDEQQLLDGLSRPLKTEIMLFNCRKLIRQVPMFSQAQDGFLMWLVTVLKTEVHNPGEDIIREGEVGAEMYFIARGSVEVIVGEKVLATLFKGQYFGEMALLSQHPLKRTATIRSLEAVEIYKLHKSDLDNVLALFPEIKVTMKMLARVRSSQLKKSEGGASSSPFGGVLAKMRNSVSTGSASEETKDQPDGLREVSPSADLGGLFQSDASLTFVNPKPLHNISNNFGKLESGENDSESDEDGEFTKKRDAPPPQPTSVKGLVPLSGVNDLQSKDRNTPLTKSPEPEPAQNVSIDGKSASLASPASSEHRVDKISLNGQS